MSKDRRLGSIADDLGKPGGFGDSEGQVVKEVIACQVAEAMKSRSLSNARLAALLETSQAQVRRLLDPQSDVTQSTLQRAGAMVGRKLQKQLV